MSLAHLGPDLKKPGRHALEIFAFEPAVATSGLLNVFRAPPARFLGNCEPSIPACPGDVKINALSQTIVHDVFCSNARFLLKISGSKPTTDKQDGVDGMSCKQEAELPHQHEGHPLFCRFF